MKPYPLAGDLDGVAVDHAGMPGDVGQGHRRHEYRQRESNQVAGHGLDTVIPVKPKRQWLRDGECYPDAIGLTVTQARAG